MVTSRQPFPTRTRPHHEVLPIGSRPAIVFLTVCTKNRLPWLATAAVHALLRETWQKASAWQVGRYVVMPDHIHLFVAPGEMEIALDNWVRYWKSLFTVRHARPEHRWQTGYWDTRLRSSESYDGKWEYVRNNPVRHALVARAEEWEYQGELVDLTW